MAIITSLEHTRRDPSRVSVFLDGAFGFALAEEIVLTARLRVGEAIDDDTIARLAERDTVSRACQAAYRFLGARPRSEAEVRRRLLQHGFPASAVEAASQRLRELGYLDDRAFADFWIENRREFKPRSARLIAQELRQKGVAADAIDLTDWDDETAAQEAGAHWIRSRRFANQLDFDHRVGNFLLRRGFGHEAVRSAVRQLWAAREEAQSAS